jgi:hypothetical protein
MRISAAQRTENESRIRAAMDRLLRGEITPGGKCDIKTLANEAAVDRTAFYGTRLTRTSAPSSNDGSRHFKTSARSPTLARPGSPGSRQRTPSSDGG